MKYVEIEKALSRLPLADILHQVPTGIILAEAPSGRLLMKNRVAEEILGMPLPYVDNIKDYVRHYKGLDREGKAYESQDWPLSRSIMNGETVKGEEINFIREDGTAIVIKVNSAPIYDSEGKAIAAIASFYDITMQLRAETLVKDSLQRYQTLLDTVDGIVWEADACFNFTFVSQKAERISGFTKEEWMQPNFWPNHIYPEDRDQAVNFCKEQFAKALPHDFEYRLLTKDNKVIWLRDIVSVVIKDGSFAGLRGIMVDITENKRIAELLGRSEERLKTILENEPECVQITNSKGILLEINPAGLTMYEAEQSDQLTGHSIYPLIAGPYRKAYQDFNERVSRGEKGLLEYEIVSLQGTQRWLEAHAVPFIHQETKDTQILSVVRDITENKKMDIHREELFKNERAARIGAEKSIHMRDDFLSVASHELKTPLTPIRVQIQLVLRDLKLIADKIPAASMIKHLEEADKQFSRFLKLVDNLLDVSRISGDRLILIHEKINLTNLIQELAHSFLTEIYDCGCTLELDLEPNVIGHWDRIRLDQVLVNLISNAEKYGRGNPIKISLKKIMNDLNKPIAVISVQDKGIGISKADQEKLFKKFERVASIRHFGGLGLGLYITRNIVNAHHGKIRVESEFGKGSTFIIELPIN